MTQEAQGEAGTVAPGTGEEKRPVKLRFTEKLLTVVALVVVVAWILIWSTRGLDVDWFSTLSFLGSLAIVAFVVARRAGALSPPERVEKMALPLLSLVPLLGYLVTRLTDFWRFLAEVGTIALAYIAATAYWRKHIPEVVANPASREEAEGTAPPAAAKEERREPAAGGAGDVQGAGS